MKTVLEKISLFLDGFARARAATHLSRMGRHDLAKELMLRD